VLGNDKRSQKITHTNVWRFYNFIYFMQNLLKTVKTCFISDLFSAKSMTSLLHKFNNSRSNVQDFRNIGRSRKSRKFIIIRYKIPFVLFIVFKNFSQIGHLYPGLFVDSSVFWFTVADDFIFVNTQ